MLARTSSRELTEQQLYDRTEQDERWLMVGAICATIANSTPYRSATAEPAKPSDFMPRLGDVTSEEAQTPDQMRGAFRSMAKAE